MRQPSPARRRLPAVGAATVVAILVGLLLAGPATAHDALLGSEPADGEKVARGPAEVLLTFSADQLDVGTVVRVLDADDEDWADGAAAVEGPLVRQSLAPDMPAGTYDVTWRAVSGDGHALTGTFTFEVLDGPASPTATPTASPTPMTTATPSTPSPDPTEPATAAERDDDAAVSGTWPVAVVPGALVLVALGALVLVGRRRRR